VADSDTGGVQVDVDPTQPEQLAAAHAGGGGQQPGGVLPITLDMGQVERLAGENQRLRPVENVPVGRCHGR
jgi:hypothetical protein